jgi:hypothetical protein
VLGGSAGGYLTLCTGYLVEPRPAALVSFWGSSPNMVRTIRCSALKTASQ